MNQYPATYFNYESISSQQKRENKNFNRFLCFFVICFIFLLAVLNKKYPNFIFQSNKTNHTVHNQTNSTNTTINLT